MQLLACISLFRVMVIVKARSLLFLLFYVVVWCCVSVDSQCEPDAVPCGGDCLPTPDCCFSMNEETEVGVVVGNVNIVTEIKDALMNPSHSIEVVDFNEFLVNNSTGEVQVNTVVDREEPDMSCISIPVRLNNPGLSLKHVGAVVTDINDHSPEFPVDSHSEERQEEMELQFCIEVITQLEATDRDIGPNGDITYRLGGDVASKFEIVFNEEEDSYCIQSTGRLDREEVANPSNTQVYSLTLVLFASDSGTPPKHDNMTFTVTLTDINDNAPAFTKESLEPVTVLENRTNGVIRVLNATDQDYNNELVYSIDLSESPPFEIDSNTGQLSVAAVGERLNLNGYNLTIIVSDSVQSTTETLIVNVLDVNEKATITPFRQPEVREENSGYLFRYRIDDPDTAYPDSYLVELLGPYKDRFSYNVTKNQLILITIRLIHPIDQEALIEETGNSSVVLGFRVTEVGLNNHTHDFEINIPIIGINDNLPTLSETVFNFEEEQSPGTRVAELVGHDLDSGDDGKVVSYCVISAKAYPNNQEDLISTFLMLPENTNCEDPSLVAPKLDRENDIENITVIMELTDGGGRSNRVNVTIFVEDINDNYPTFHQEVYEFNFEEGEVNITGGPFEATDADIGSNADIRYELLDHHDKFSVDNVTGAVRTKVVFDREEQDNYTIHIRAVNVVSTTHNAVSVRDVAKVQVTIIDVNDNPPVWENIPTTVTISSDSSVGTFVIVLTATDADIGDNAAISYKLDPSRLFDITTDNGIIRVKANLENENYGHNVLVTAFNTHDPEQSNVRNITIVVEEPSSSSSSSSVIIGSISGVVTLVIVVVILMLVVLLWVYWDKRQRSRKLEKRRSDIIDGISSPTRSILRPIPSSSVEFNGRSCSLNGKGREVKFDTNVQEYGYDDEHAVSNSSNVCVTEFTIRPDSSGDESPATPPRLPSASLHRNGKLPSESFSHMSNGAPRLPSSNLYTHHPHPIHEDNFYDEDSENNYSDDDSTLPDNASSTNAHIPSVRHLSRMVPSPHSPANTNLPPLPLMVPSHPFTHSPNHGATLTPPHHDELSIRSSSSDSLTDTPPHAHSHLSHENQHNRQSSRGPYPKHMPDGYIPPPSSTAVAARFGATSFLDHFQGTDFEDTSTYASADLDEELKFHPEQTPSIYRLTTTSYDESQL